MSFWMGTGSAVCRVLHTAPAKPLCSSGPVFCVSRLSRKGIVMMADVFLMLFRAADSVEELGKVACPSLPPDSKQLCQDKMMGWRGISSSKPFTS